MIEKFQICEDFDFCLGQLDKNAKLAVAISRERALSSRSELSSRFCFEHPQTIYEYPMTFLVRRNFSHLNELNQFIQMASAGGLIKKWHANSHIQTLTSKENTFGNLTLNHYYGCIIIWSIIVLINIFILLLERLVHKKVRLSNPSQFWIIIEMLIDPDRHFWLENKTM